MFTAKRVAFCAASTGFSCSTLFAADHTSPRLAKKLETPERTTPGTARSYALATGWQGGLVDAAVERVHRAIEGLQRVARVGCMSADREQPCTGREGG